MGQIIDGKAVSAKVKEEIRLETEKLKEQGIEIGLAVVIVGDDPASQVYVRNKGKRLAKLWALIHSSMLSLRKQQKKSFSTLSKSSMMTTEWTEYSFSSHCQSTLTIK